MRRAIEGQVWRNAKTGVYVTVRYVERTVNEHKERSVVYSYAGSDGFIHTEIAEESTFVANHTIG